MPTVERHVPVLDGIRGLAILLVMMCHFNGPRLPDSTASTIERAYRAVTFAGWTGVDLFFVLSGFLITGILVDAKNGRHFFRHFYVRRFLRIFPVYYGTLTVFFIVIPLMVRTSEGYQLLLQDQPWYWSYLSNLRIAHVGWPEYLGHFWSLAVEEQFYMVWPLVVWLSSRRALARLCVLSIAAALLVRLALFWTDRGLAAYVLAPARMDALAIGGLLALVTREQNGLAMWRAQAYWAFAVSGTALTGIFMWKRGLTPGDPVVYTVGFSLLAVFFGSLLTLAVTSTRGGLIDRGLSSGPLTILGRYSYALYVFHAPLIEVLHKQSISVHHFQGFLGSHVVGYLAYVFLAGSTSIILAALSWHLYESRILRLKDRFPYEPAGSAHSPQREVKAIRVAPQV